MDLNAEMVIDGHQETLRSSCVQDLTLEGLCVPAAFVLRSSSARIKDCEILQIRVEPDCVRAAYGLRTGFVRRISVAVLISEI